MSEKLDGMRAYWTGSRMLTSGGNPIAIPDWLATVLPMKPLDGELWLGRGRFQELVSVVRKNTPRDPRWIEVRYLVFDSPGSPGERKPCEVRFADLAATVSKICVLWGRMKVPGMVPGGNAPHRRGSRPKDCPVVLVEQIKCRSRADLERFHARIVKLGGEGAMIRAPGTLYRRSRTSDMLKVLKLHRAEARVVGHAPGKGKHRGRLGAYQARLLDSGAIFRVGTGISDAERQDPLPVGSVITVQFKGLSGSGRPRHPTYIGPRDYE